MNQFSSPEMDGDRAELICN